jgi:hypothetical protein
VPVEPVTLALLIAAAFVAAFVDSNVGGGCFNSLPALLATGMPVHLALGTNKLAATGASMMATARYAHAGLISRRLALGLVGFAFAGAMLGATTVLRVDPSFVRGLVVAVMALMTAWVVARKRFGLHDHSATRPRWAWFTLAPLSLAIGAYDGFLGPGTGTFFLFAFIGLAGFDFLKAAGHGRVLNFATNLGALLLFAFQRSVDYAIGLPMMAAMLAGAFLGSTYFIRHGAKFIKPLFVAISLALMGKLLYDLWP